MKNIYTRHFFKMRKILTGAKLLLMSIIIIMTIVLNVICVMIILTFDMKQQNIHVMTQNILKESVEFIYFFFFGAVQKQYNVTDCDYVIQIVIYILNDLSLILIKHTSNAQHTKCKFNISGIFSIYCTITVLNLF